MLNNCWGLLRVAASNDHPDIIWYRSTKYDISKPKVDCFHAVRAAYCGLGCYRMIYNRNLSLLDASIEFYGSALLHAISTSDHGLLTFISKHGGDPGRVISEDVPLWVHGYTPIETTALNACPKVVKDSDPSRRYARLHCSVGASCTRLKKVDAPRNGGLPSRTRRRAPCS